jgi:hypothetical protein
MRKSAAVKLTLVPLLAASAMAYAQAPGVTEPVLSPPGMTATIDELACDEDPNWQLREDCSEAEIDGQSVIVETDVVRGGYGGYFWTGGG